jgi:arylsulfatase A-like enzyme
MNKNNKMIWFTGVGLACLPTLLWAKQNAQQPNILFILCDDMGYGDLACYGQPFIHTPHIDQMAKEGMRFTQAYAGSPVSAPSRATIMTGQHTGHTHVRGNKEYWRGVPMIKYGENEEYSVVGQEPYDPQHKILPEMLKDKGYRTGVFGKWAGGYEGSASTPDKRGDYKQENGYVTDLITDHAIEYLDQRDKNKPFCLMVHHKAPHRIWMPSTKYVSKYANVNFPLPATFWDDYESRGSAAHTQKMSIDKYMEMVRDLKVPEMYDPTTAEGRDSYAGLQSEMGRMTPEQREAIDAYYMPRNREFLSKNLTGKELVEWKYQNYICDYMAVIASIDESVGRLLDYLDQHHLTDNTIIVYTSDQGFYMGEHGWFDKRFMYEESFRTPLIVSYPKHIKEGSYCNQMVQNIDFAPTFLDLAGLEKPKYMPGTSLQPLFAGQPVKKWRNSLYYHYYDYPNYHLVRKHDGVRTERYKLIHFYGKGGENAVQENKYQRQPGTTEYNCFQYLKSINYITQDAEVDYYELYDIKADPTEMHNLYGQPGMQKVEKEMKKLLATYRKNLKVDE